jgi:[ribosomal protein S18]-alanine N-acetyltransferase
MSAQLDMWPRNRAMTESDIESVVAIEEATYPHPWTHGNFSDSLAAGYGCRVVECGGTIAGYAVVMVAAGEAHLLNLTMAAPWQRRGLGRALLEFMLALARDEAATTVLLEVRPSNLPARALYARAGFAEVGLRRDYYPAGQGREDALVLALDLGGRVADPV